MVIAIPQWGSVEFSGDVFEMGLWKVCYSFGCIELLESDVDGTKDLFHKKHLLGKQGGEVSLWNHDSLSLWGKGIIIH